MGNYFLVARNKENNSFKIININDKWYLGDKGFGCLSRANDLEAIDLVTTRFKDKEEMIARMYNHKYLDSTNVDLFIATKRKRNNEERIVTYEIIYNPKNSGRIEDFREISKSFIDRKVDKQKNARVLDKLISKAYHNEEYYHFIQTRMTNIPKRLTESLIGIQQRAKAPYGIKYNQSWALTSYTAIRNIIESLNRFDLFDDKIDKARANSDFLGENISGRKKISDQLSIKIDKDYVEGQYSLFDQINHAEQPSISNNSPAINETGIDNKNNENNEISTKEKLGEVLMTFESLPFGVFIRNNDGVIFNENIFSNNIPTEEISKLKTLIKGNFLLDVYLYVFHNNKYKEALQYQCNSLEIQEDVRKDLKTIGKALKKEKTLDKAYEWCQIYSKCLNYKEQTDDINTTKNNEKRLTKQRK